MIANRFAMIPLISFVVLASLTPARVVARTWCVNPFGTGDAPDIQAGIDSAVAGDTVSLADGFYNGDGNRDIDFSGKAVTVRSASGIPSACVIDCEGSASEPHIGFLFLSGETPSSLLEGITIQRGYSMFVGGVGIDNSSPTINNCFFIENAATVGGGGIGCGDGSPVISYCKFFMNKAQAGGAAYFNNSSPTLTFCTFEGDSALSSGGAFLSEHGSPSLQNCTFRHNWAAQDGGAILCFYDDDVTITNVSLKDNEAGQAGGGIYLEDVVLATVEGCTLTTNTAEFGGGIYAVGAVTVDHCTIAENTATQAGGGLAYLGGPSLEITDCTFVANSSALGSGIAYNDGGIVEVTRTIVAIGVTGSAVYCFGGAIAVYNCCNFYDNDGGDWVGCAAGKDGIMGNFSADPEFCGAYGSGNYFLQSDSPCAPGNHPDGDACGVIGAWAVGCNTTVTKEATWGQLKSLFKK